MTSFIRKMLINVSDFLSGGLDIEVIDVNLVDFDDEVCDHGESSESIFDELKYNDKLDKINVETIGNHY